MPSEGIGSSPVQRFMNRRTRSLLPMSSSLLQPRSIDHCNERSKLKQQQLKQSHYYNKGAHDLPALDEGDTVRMKSFKLGQREWQKGQLTKCLDQTSFEVKTPSGVFRRNRVHLKKTEEPLSTSPVKLPSDEVPSTPSRHNTRSLLPVPSPTKADKLIATPSTPKKTLATTPIKSQTPSRLPRPQRLTKPPAYLKDFVTK